MRLLASLVYCLLALAGCHERSGTTAITRATENGQDVLFSKTLTSTQGIDVHCLASRSGRCHYRIYLDRCAAAATTGPACTRSTLDSFSLRAGQTRLLQGLSADARTCVGTSAPRPDCHG
ncbi:hypothetical protein [Xanthomonas maliensis]|uniref:hypothetical protein n=1 Tax=Xanthomonas maliensis TaxID=1321368 RepID=UPI0003A43C4A|nr:hypothetical protein [Xanthomonas maliensis]KAB7762115.1 hypothetical protein CKY51_21950 [Xanthomonas maliensis]